MTHALAELVRKVDTEDTQSWLREGIPRGAGLPPAKVLAAQILTLRDALAGAMRQQRKRYAAYIREHPPAQPVLKKKHPFDDLPPGAALEWQTWLAEVVSRAGAVEVDAEELAQALQVAARAGVGEGAVAGSRATGLLPAGARELTVAQARKALVEVRAFEPSTDRARRAIRQALDQASRTTGVRALVLRDGAGRIVAAASYRVQKGLLEIEYLGALEREVPGTGVQLMREIAAVAVKSKRGLAVTAGPESEAFFSGLGMQRATAAAGGTVFSLAPGSAEGLAAGSFAGQVPVWLAAGWLEGPAATFRAADGAASLVAENGSTLAEAAYKLGEKGPLKVTSLDLGADVAPGVERRMLRELAAVARQAERGLELPLESGRMALYERLGANARAAWGVQEARRLASGLSALPGFSGQLSWELGVAGAPEWLRGHRIRGVVDEISATTHGTLVNTLADGLKAGETTEQLAQRVMGLDKAFGRLRAERIARTEVLTANRWGARFIALAGGATEHEWHARMDLRTRRWHREANRQRRPIMEPFVVNNRKGEPEKLMVPGDYVSFDAGPDNTIQCRCSVRYHKPGVTYEPPKPQQHGLAGSRRAPFAVVAKEDPLTKRADRVEKHRPGGHDHDQSTHGRRRAAEPEGKEPKIYRPPAERIAGLQESAEGYVLTWAVANDVSLDDGMEKARRLMGEAAAGPVKINLSIQGSMKVLEDGRFESQFESGTSGGNLDTDLRMRAEKAGLGIPEDIDPTQRPIYGYSYGSAQRYGEVEWTLKEAVKDRATMTLGDSLGGFMEDRIIGTPMRAPGLEGFHGEWATDVLLRQGLDSVPYVETQIQGGVALEDVAEVRIRAYNWTAEHEAFLDELVDRGIDAYMETQ
ncbi:MAG: phage minor head protein [Thermoleophilia bacterium]